MLLEDEARKAVALSDITAMRSALAAEIKDLQKRRRRADEAARVEFDAAIAEKETAHAEAERMMRDVGGSDNSIGRPLPEREVIPAQTSLRGGMTLATPNEHALGLHISSLRLWADSPRFGAMESKGYGFVDADWRVMGAERELGKPNVWREIGRIQVIDGQFTITGDELLQREASWADGLEIDLQRAVVATQTLEKLAQPTA